MDPVNTPAKFEVRRFTHSWDNRGYSENLDSRWIGPRSLFFQIFKGLLFGWTLWIYLPTLKFVALRVWEIIRVLKKFGKSLDMPTLFFLPYFKGAFARMDPVNIPAKFEVHSFTHSWDNRGYSKNLWSPWIRPRSLFSKFLRGFCSHAHSEYTCQICSP